MIKLDYIYSLFTTSVNFLKENADFYISHNLTPKRKVLNRLGFFYINFNMMESV